MNFDLDKIVKFMNSDPEDPDEQPVEEKKELTTEIATTDIENTINYIDNQIAEVSNNIKDVKTVEDVERNKTMIDEITQVALEEFRKVDSKTDEIYDLFYTPISMRTDRTDASKEALVESQRLKIEMVNALANLANANARVEMAKQKQNMGNTGIFINSVPGKDVGISMHNLWQETKEEEE